jgi:hypothetical protein
MLETRFDVRFDVGSDPDTGPPPTAVVSDALLVALLDLALSADRSTDDRDSPERTDEETTPDG